MAGFRNGRGRNPHGARQQGQGRPPYEQGPTPGYGAPQRPHGAPGGQWQGGPGGQGAQGGPEYFAGGPHRSDNPGHTQPYGVGYSPEAHGQQGPYQQAPYQQGQTYQSGGAPVPAGPRLHWKDLLSGIVRHPDRTFWQMRDHTLWGPALTVTFLYGVLAIFGFEEARTDVLNSTLATSVPYVLATCVFVLIGFLLLGVVTHTLARQLGGNGTWAPTVGLSMLIVSLTDAPRLLLAMFLGGDATPVQAVGWATLVVAGALLTLMTARSHDLPWPRALAASSIQLLALLFLIKLGTL
ncbi:Yip1 family protein [Streptomyces polyrhachis]|uniref:Yip1 family protein n=1 Tax=Streptomyces polyrhachis TaxID=1282885 RepID=A0ABW2GAT8_9ACTN